MARTELLRSPQCPPVRSARRSVGWRPPPGHAHACGCPLLQSFGLLCACAAAAHRLHPASTVFFSLGTISARALTRRLLAREVRADLQRIWAGRLSDDDWRRLARAAGGLWKAPLFINDTPGLSVAEISAICRCLSGGRLGSEGEVRVPQESSSGGYGCDRATHVPSLQSLRRLAERGGVAALTLAPAWPEESKSRVASETTGISDLVRETVERTQEQAGTPTFSPVCAWRPGKAWRRPTSRSSCNTTGGIAWWAPARVTLPAGASPLSPCETLRKWLWSGGAQALSGRPNRLASLRRRAWALRRGSSPQSVRGQRGQAN